MSKDVYKKGRRCRKEKRVKKNTAMAQKKRGEMRWEKQGDLITLETKAQNPSKEKRGRFKMLKL